MKEIGLVILGLALIALPVSCTVSVWNECRAEGHSFIYCMHLIDSK